MLKKLRLKFILINMIIVTIMLGVIFGLMYYSTERNLEQESIGMMEKLAENPRMPGPPDKPHHDIHLPYFSILLDRNGEISEVDGNFYDLSDTDKLNSILDLTYETKSKEGVLEEYKLRFLHSETPMGPRIVFVDMTSEQSTLRNMIRTFSIVGSAAFLIFLAVSVFLARWAVKPVEMAWEQQKQFVADASHELKTPLTVIMTDAELLNAPDCPEEDRESLSEGILTMSYQMRGLVDNLLDLARIDNGSPKEDFENVSFSNIVSDAVMMFEPIFFEKGLSLRYEIEPDICIKGIDSRLKQLVCILLDNAGKYALPEGETIVKVSRCTRNKLLLDVSNRGEPISDEDMKNIFKRFYRADKARTMNHSYGLGLSIAQSIAEEHHGKIWAESEGGYNRFYVEMPECCTGRLWGE